MMSLKTRLGNLGNIADAEADQLNLVLLESPILLDHELESLKLHLEKNTTEIDCTYAKDLNKNFLQEIILSI